MNWLTIIWISGRVVKRYGVRAAAVFGWIFCQCQSQVSREQCKPAGIPRVYRKTVRVRVSCSELGRLLHLSRHTVEAILHTLAADGILDVWLPRGEDRTRAYSIAPKGFTLLGRWFGEWYVPSEEILSCWGLDTRVASKVGVNAAIVFQYLWHWSRNWRWSAHYTKDGRACLPYTAAELSRWIVFMSDDVLEDALHVLVSEGLLVKLRQGNVTKWSVTDTGFTAMGEMPPVQCEGTEEVAHEAREATGTQTAQDSVASDDGARRVFRASKRQTRCIREADAAIWAQAEARRRAARNRRRRLRRKGLTEWSPLSL